MLRLVRGGAGGVAHRAADFIGSWVPARRWRATIGVLLLLGLGGQAAAAVLSAPSTGASALVLLLAMVWTRDWSMESGLLLAAGLCMGLTSVLAWTMLRRFRDPALAVPHRGILLAAPAAGSRACAAPGSAPHEVLSTAKLCFLNLQSAWDAADVERLRCHTTAAMLENLLQELPARGSLPNQTDVLTLEAALLVLEQSAGEEIASVEFSGLIRESPDLPGVAFDEVWMLVRRQGGGEDWRLARQVALL